MKEQHFFSLEGTTVIMVRDLEHWSEVRTTISVVPGRIYCAPSELKRPVKRGPHLTSSVKEVGDLCHSYIVGHMWLTSGGCTPVDTDVLAFLQHSIQSVLS